MGAKKACPPSTTLTSTKPATPAPALLGLLSLHVLWQNETESEPLVAVEVCISPNQPAAGDVLNVLNVRPFLAQLVIICLSTVVLYCQI